MIKKITAFLFLATVASQAATITLNKGLSPGFMVLDSSGANAGGTTLFIGTWAGGTEPPTLGADPAGALASFRVFGTAAGPAAGAPITGSVTTIPGTPADFNTLKMYIVVANSNSLATATQAFVGVNTPATSFPADTTAASSTNFNVNTFANLAPVQAVGSTVNNATGPESLRMVNLDVIPEPSTRDRKSVV